MATPLLAPNKDNYLVSANGRLGNPPQSAITEVSRILDHAMQQGPAKGLVIHMHGGLVSRDSALNDITARLTPRYQEAGAYPLFFVWESGFKEALLNNKSDILNDPAFRELVKKVSEWVVAKISPVGGVNFKGAGGVPITDVDRFRQEYDRWFDNLRQAPPVEDSDIAGDAQATTRSTAGIPDLDDLASDIERQLDDDPEFKRVLGRAFNAANPPGVVVTTKGAGTTERATVLLISPDALDEMFPATGPASTDARVKTRGVFTWLNVARYAAGIVIAVLKRFRSHRDHGVYCTIVEEVLQSAYGDLIGATVWNAMKKDTLDSFANGTDTCGRLVVQKIREMEKAGKQFKKITLVGHSTGAIYICNFLDAARSAGLETPIQVVFLAPAVTCQRFARAINDHEGTYLRDFRMFAMRDAREQQDAMLKPLYTRSLLYFVSGLLEGNDVDGKWTSEEDMPLVGMERFFTQAAFSNDAQVQKVWQFFNAKANRLVWSRAADAGVGLNSDSQHHGDFDNDESTLISLMNIIRG
jgi:hypothetical protein